jgi:SSS family solute:Na+ symporter
MNFLHFAILMFVVCLVILVVVSLLTPAPSHDKVAGLTFQTVQELVSLREVESESILAAPAEVETAGQKRLNTALASILMVTIISLWIYFA